MAQPFLYLGDVRFMGERIGGGRGPHRMHAQPIDLHIQARRLPILSHHIPIVIEKERGQILSCASRWATLRLIARHLRIEFPGALYHVITS